MMDLDKTDWKPVTFGEVVREVRETVSDFEAEGIERSVGLEHIESENIHIRSWGNVGDAATFNRRFRKGQVLFGRRRAYLKKAALADFDGVCSGDITVLEAKPDLLLPELLPFLVQNDRFFAYAVEKSAGSLSPRAKFQDLAPFPFLLPPKDQQARLAELLWAGDEVVEGLYNLLETNNVLLYSFREEKLCSKKHPRKKLGNSLQEITAGKSLNGTNVPATNGQKGVLKVSAVGANGFEAEENKVLTTQEEFLEKFKVNKLDVLITRANTTELVGRTCLVEKDYPNLMLSDKTLRLDVKEEFLNRLFLVEILRSKESRQQIEGFATGTGGAMKNISQNEIKSIKIPFPQKGVQDVLAKQLNSVLKNRDEIKNKIYSSKNLLKSLISQIF